ncbi:hypothetical protein HAX54_045896 [Datura stramonium]|uniref:Uncharacterized protein n=1 Tax=Datura stramonium TaxID=4076 RepID=A0ABS8SR33_DATST|nr:hypothetical protein [Datura stramonium]
MQGKHSSTPVEDFVSNSSMLSPPQHYTWWCHAVFITNTPIFITVGIAAASKILRTSVLGHSPELEKEATC